MKRQGYIYDKMADWSLIKEAERVSLANKKHNRGYVLHERAWLRDLVAIQDLVINHKMHTGDYKHEKLVSGQGKMRDIAKLNFFPSHIEHQLLVMAGNDRLDKVLIKHTYASRKNYGQHKGALQMNKWIQEKHEEYPWYLQFDIIKYYEHIPHTLIRQELEKRFKDRDYIDAFMEPIEKFANGIGIPLGIRPSQTFGNLALSSIDRYIKETLRCKYYIRYLDDGVILCHTKAEAKRKIRQIERQLNAIGFEIHQPRIDRVLNGIDFLGYVTYPGRGMFWRRENKARWLRLRSRVTNARRVRELDSSAWGFLSHGNNYCKKLYRTMNGIPFSKLGIKRPDSTDKNGKRIIEAPKMSMEMLLNKEVDILDVVDGIETQHGKDRVAILVSVMGTEGKVIVNAPFKEMLVQLWNKGVTGVSTVMIDRGGKHYDMDYSRTNLISVNHRAVGIKDGEICYMDNFERVNIKL